MPITKILAAATGSGKTALAALSAHNYKGNGATPQDYGQAHSTWRPHQREAWQWLTSGAGRRVMALCRTKNLQIHQYAGEYNFQYLTGRSNWPCVHSLNPGATADQCLHGTNMHACEYSKNCRYLRQKRRVQESNLASLNYALFLTSFWPRQSLIDDPDAYLYADECHELSELIIGHVSTTVTKADRKDYSLPPFPKLVGKSTNKLLAGTGQDVIGPTLAWLQECLPILENASDHWDHQLKEERLDDCVSAETMKMAKRTDNLLRKVENTHEAIETNQDDWYIRSGPNSRQVRDRSTGQMKSEPAFVCKPLTARHFYNAFFEHGQQTVLMSATIGGIDQYTEELGLASDEYEFHSVPNQFTPEQRPIYTLDCPPMGAKKQKESWAQFNARFDEQARVIANAIKDCPSHWSGLIHVTRKTEAKLLCERLAKHGLGNRVWPSTGAGDEYVPTDQQVANWAARKQSVSNSIGVFWSLGTGYNGLSERINIAAKAPFPVFGSAGSYEAAWRKHSNARYRWTAACQLAQILGRTRRGRDEDYDTPTEKRGLVAIADKSWTQCKKYLPRDILDAIREY